MPTTSRLFAIARVGSFVQLILLAAIFGFFYAYACSAMWGLDLVPGAVAIEAMNGINTAVRNAVFAPAFFGPLPVGVLVVALLWFAGQKTSTFWFAAALVIYAAGAFAVTASVSVPMNRAMLAAEIPTDPATAQQVWDAYSAKWQLWNWVRTGFSGLAFLSAAMGLYMPGRK